MAVGIGSWHRKVDSCQLPKEKLVLQIRAPRSRKFDEQTARLITAERDGYIGVMATLASSPSTAIPIRACWKAAVTLRRDLQRGVFVKSKQNGGPDLLLEFSPRPSMLEASIGKRDVDSCQMPKLKLVSQIRTTQRCKSDERTARLITAERDGYVGVMATLASSLH